MTEQDDPSRKDKKSTGEEVVEGQESQATAEPTEPGVKKSKTDIAGGSIAGGEVRAVESPPRSTPSKLPLVLLGLVVLLLVGGYLMIRGDGTPKPAVVSAPQRQPIPIRPQADKEVKEELIEQKQMPVAEPETAEEKPAAPVAAGTVETAAESPQVVAAEKTPVASQEVKATEPGALYSVMVGPYLSNAKLESAREQLRKMGFEPSQTTGRGILRMIRLLEGIYPADEARTRLAALKKKAKSAFVLPAGDQRALYAGSFEDIERAEKLRTKLAAEGVKLTPVSSDIELNGKMLIAVQADQQTAQQVAEHINTAGLQAQLVRK